MVSHTLGMNWSTLTHTGRAIPAVLPVSDELVYIKVGSASHQAPKSCCLEPSFSSDAPKDVWAMPASTHERCCCECAPRRVWTRE